MLLSWKKENDQDYKNKMLPITVIGKLRSMIVDIDPWINKKCINYLFGGTFLNAQRSMLEYIRGLNDKRS